MIAALLLAHLFLLPDEVQKAAPQLVPEHWQVESDSRILVHTPTQFGFPLELDDFKLIECKNLKEPLRSGGIAYGSERKGGVRVLILFYNKAVLGSESAEDASKEWIASMAIDIAKKSGRSTPLSGGIAFDVTVAGKTIPVHTTIEPAQDP